MSDRTWYAIKDPFGEIVSAAPLALVAWDQAGVYIASPWKACSDDPRAREMIAEAERVGYRCVEVELAEPEVKP